MSVDGELVKSNELFDEQLSLTELKVGYHVRINLLRVIRISMLALLSDHTSIGAQSYRS